MERQISVGWRSGSAGALQAQGRGFKSLTDHHKNQARAILLWPVLIPNPLWGHVRGCPFYFSKGASVSGFGKRGSAPFRYAAQTGAGRPCGAGRGKVSVQRRQRRVHRTHVFSRFRALVVLFQQIRAIGQRTRPACPAIGSVTISVQQRAALRVDRIRDCV